MSDKIPAGCPFCGALPCDQVEKPHWRSMETAPKDGSVVIYRHDDGLGRMSWQPDDCGHDWYDLDGDQIAHPEGWLPMPVIPHPSIR